MEIPYPEKFDFVATKWPAWKQSFMRSHQALDFAGKSKKQQLNMLIYCMGDKPEDFNLASDDAKKFDIVLQKIEDHFVIKKSVFFERAKFIMRCQEPNALVESFITTLHKFSEHCNYGPLATN